MQTDILLLHNVVNVSLVVYTELPFLPNHNAFYHQFIVARISLTLINTHMNIYILFIIYERINIYKNTHTHIIQSCEIIYLLQWRLLEEQEHVLFTNESPLFSSPDEMLQTLLKSSY